MRAFIATTLNKDDALRGMGLALDSVYSSNNVDTPATKPFIVVKWTDRHSDFSVHRDAPSQPNLCDIWFYDKPGDYSRIDAMIARVHALFSSVQAQRTATGWVTQIDWIGDGEDSYDDVWEAICRTSSYRVIASYLSD